MPHDPTSTAVHHERLNGHVDDAPHGSSADHAPNIIANPVCSNGISTRNYTWHEVCTVVAANRLELLGRLPSQIDVYWHFRDIKLQKFQTLADDVIHQKFGTDIVLDEATGKYTAKLADLTDDSRPWPPEQRLPKHVYYKTSVVSADNRTVFVPIIFCPNDYGYALDADILHYLIWSAVVLDDVTVNEIIRRELPSDKYEVVKFVNPPALQSVKNLWHCHLFVRQLPASLQTDKSSNRHLPAEPTHMSSHLIK